MPILKVNFFFFQISLLSQLKDPESKVENQFFNLEKNWTFVQITKLEIVQRLNEKVQLIHNILSLQFSWNIIKIRFCFNIFE